MGLRVKPFGERLRDARDAADLSQVELADRLGVSARTIQYWEAGRIVPQPKHRRALADFLDETERAAA